MGTVNLGRVRDRVTGVERIHGNGEAGTIDTYRVSFESSNYYDFNVTNGRNGVGQIITFSGNSVTKDNLIFKIVNNQDKVLALFIKSSEQNDGYMQVSFKVEKTITSNYVVFVYGPTGSLLFQALYSTSVSLPIVTFTFESGFNENYLNAWYLLCYNDSSTGLTVDDELSDNSTNPVQNKVIAKFANEVVENKANVDGNYPTMTVGNANNLIATKGLEVESYFTFEKTGGEQASAIETGNGTLKNLYGKTEKSENLLVYDFLNNSWEDHGVSWIFHDDGRITYSGTLTSSNSTFTLGTSSAIRKIFKNGVTYIAKLFSTPSVNIRLQTWDSVNGIQSFDTARTFVMPDSSVSQNFALVLFGTNGEQISGTLYPMLVQGSTAPTEWKQGYEGLKHTHITGLKSTGINLWDEEWEVGNIDITTGENLAANNVIRCKNYIKVVPNGTYYFKTANVQLFYFLYDENKNFLGITSSVINGTLTVSPLCHYIRFRMSSLYGTTYNHDICINFSNPNIDGNYYPYEEETLNIDFEGNGVGTASDEINVEEKKKYQRFGIVDLGTLNWYKSESNPRFQSDEIADIVNSVYPNRTSNIICSKYATTTIDNISEDKKVLINQKYVVIFDSDYDNAVAFKTAMSGVMLVYELATPIVTDVSIPNDTIKVWNGGSMEALGTEVPVGTKIFYQKNIKAFVEAFGEAIDWNPERIERLAKLSITPEYVNISLNPSQANAYAVAQVYNATFTIVISTALTGTLNGEITFQDSEIDLSSFETQPAESIYDMDGKKVSEEPTTEDCNIASFVGRSYNGIVLWSLLHSGVNKVKVHFEQAIPLDSEGNGKLDCRASLIL